MEDILGSEVSEKEARRNYFKAVEGTLAKIAEATGEVVRDMGQGR